MDKKQYIWALVRGKGVDLSSRDSRVTELLSTFLSRKSAEEAAKVQIELSTKSERYAHRYSVVDETLWSRDKGESWVSVARYELRVAHCELPE